MRITINNQPVELSESEITLDELMTIRNIPAGGTAVAVNNRLITRSNWFATNIKEGDCLTIISAAFGG